MLIALLGAFFCTGATSLTGIVINRGHAILDGDRLHGADVGARSATVHASVSIFAVILPLPLALKLLDSIKNRLQLLADLIGLLAKLFQFALLPRLGC